MRFVGRSHPAIRASHDKTLELTPDPDITARATCVVAVAVEAEPAAPLAGRVRLRISAGGVHASLEADANSSWTPGGPAVVRAGLQRLPGTFATRADRTAADLPRDLVAALREPDALVTVDVRSVPAGRRVVVLFALDPLVAGPDARLRAEAAAAGDVIAQDGAARQALAGLDVRPGPQPGGDPDRRLVVAADGLPHDDSAIGAAVEVVGLAAPLAAAAASPAEGPVVLVPASADPREVLRAAGAGQRLVLATSADRVSRLVETAAEIGGRTSGVLARRYAPPVRFAADVAVDPGGREDVWVCFDPAPSADGRQDALDPAVTLALDELDAADVPTKVLARAVAALTGWPQRRAYDAVLHHRRSD